MSFLLTHYDDELFEGSTVVVAPARSFAGVRIASAEDVKNFGLFMIIYGPGGSGKTRTAGLLARSEYGAKALHVDVEGGATSLADLMDEGILDSAQATKWSDITNIRRQVEKDPEPYKTFILDNLSEIQMLALKSITSGKPQIQDWGECQAKMLEEIRAWREIARGRGLNVIMVVWDEPEKDEGTGIIKRRVSFTPSLASKVPGIVTMVGHLNVLNDGTRHLSFAPSTKSDAKFRVAPNENAASIPLNLFYGPDKNPLHDMLDTIRAGSKFPFSSYEKPKPGQR